jgi:hypothetical protein
MANSYYSIILSGFVMDITGGTTAKGIWTRNSQAREALWLRRFKWR